MRVRWSLSQLSLGSLNWLPANRRLYINEQQLSTLKITLRDNIECFINWYFWNVGGNPGVPGGNPHRPGENMQTPGVNINQ